MYHLMIITYAVIILHEADKLSTDALSYVKWMLEKFKGCNKVFFCCSDASKLESIKPLCRFIQLLEPTNDQVQPNISYFQTVNSPSPNLTGLKRYIFHVSSSLFSTDSQSTGFYSKP